MVYDCFTFFNELELLELRLHELKDVVDRWVLVENVITFQHRPKPLYFEENKHRFAEFLDRITHVVVEDSPRTDFWATEYHQRDQIARGLVDCRPDDIVIVSDVDEIPRPEAVRRFAGAKESRIRPLAMNLYYYFVNCYVGSHWCWAKVMTHAALRACKGPNDARLKSWHPEDIIQDAGWHFGYLGGVDRVIEKLKSFSHSEFSTPEYTDPEVVARSIAEGRNIIYDRGLFRFVNLDDTFPRHLLANRERYAALIKQGEFNA